MDIILPPAYLFATRAFVVEPGTAFPQKVFPGLTIMFLAGAVFAADLSSQSAGITSGGDTAGKNTSVADAPTLSAIGLTATVTGAVTTATATPVANALVKVVGTDLAVETHPDGRFRLTGLPPGPQVLDVRKLGYRRISVAVEVEAAKTLDLGVTLVTEPTEIAPVVVTAKPSLPPELAGFEARRARGSGSFFTREEIARMQPLLFTDVLRRVPGMHIQPVTGPFGTGYTVGMGRDGGAVGARSCPVLFYINGVPFPVTPDVPINHFISPEEIAAIEVYAGMSRVPPQFTSSMHNVRCGVIVVWTYSGERRHGSTPP